MNSVTQALGMLFYEVDDVVHCSTGASFSDPVCPGKPAHSNTVIECFVLHTG